MNERKKLIQLENIANPFGHNHRQIRMKYKHL